MAGLPGMERSEILYFLLLQAALSLVGPRGPCLGQPVLDPGALAGS